MLQQVQERSQTSLPARESDPPVGGKTVSCKAFSWPGLRCVLCLGGGISLPIMQFTKPEQMNHQKSSRTGPLVLKGAQENESGAGFRAGFTSIDSLTQNRRNVRRRTPRSRQMVRESLTEFGAARSVVVDEHGEILCGNGTVEAAADLGITNVLVIPTDGQTLVAVQRTDLDSTQKAGLMLADNRSSDTSVDDGEALQRLLEEEKLLDISSWYSEEEIAALSTDMPDISEEDEPPPRGKGTASLEIRLTFEASSDFQRFNKLLETLAAALPESQEISARLETAIRYYLNRHSTATTDRKATKAEKP